MKVRALCAAGLIAAAALPAGASASNSIAGRLHRADVALTRAQDAADAGNDAGVVSGLKGATRQTNLALKAASRMVAHGRNGASDALTAVTDQQDANALAAMDLLDGADATVVDAVNTTLVGVDTGRGTVLTLIQGLGDTEIDWGDSLTQVTDDAVGELASAADLYGSATFSAAAENALTAFVSHETDAAGAVFGEVATIGANADAVLDGDALDNLASDTSDAHDALDSVTGTSAANATAISGAATKLAALGDAVTTLADAVNGYSSSDSSGYDNGSYDSSSYGSGNSGSAAGSSGNQGIGNIVNTGTGSIQITIVNNWGNWAPPRHGYDGWQPSGFNDD